ncbi:hypothetical protein EGR_10022 [Echinococcus granulosus]|uniref:Uncharacterized protein n=1 Tax=Echinococcus granulosus TaxID=6210 RepID=W6U237_ECHGR|nr:hypothetical protein EGR_10022 [Echinococcus granulosus]EUB55113.1 hypothetical protein EGR_10022 [Echinococcus granulosus]
MWNCRHQKRVNASNYYCDVGICSSCLDCPTAINVYSARASVLTSSTTPILTLNKDLEGGRSVDLVFRRKIPNCRIHGQGPTTANRDGPSSNIGGCVVGDEFGTEPTQRRPNSTTQHSPRQLQIHIHFLQCMPAVEVLMQGVDKVEVIYVHVAVAFNKILHCPSDHIPKGYISYTENTVGGISRGTHLQHNVSARKYGQNHGGII